MVRRRITRQSMVHAKNRMQVVKFGFGFANRDAMDSEEGA
jgi:hypothetical protein